MKIVIFGATGFCGKAVLREALAQHHQVVVLVRNKKSLSGYESPHLTIVEGSVMDRQMVASVLKDSEAVFQCLGVGGKGTGKPTVFVSEATRIIVEEMQKQSIRKLIALSNVGAGNSIEFLPWFFTKIILPFFMRWLYEIIEDKNRMEAAIAESGLLDWTIVRCPNVVDKPSMGSLRSTLTGKGLGHSIALGDMAKFVVQQRINGEYSKKMPSISN
jgi:uncharacterized protein YbjT (DUF2867 family)